MRDGAHSEDRYRVQRSEPGTGMACPGRPSPDPHPALPRDRLLEQGAVGDAERSEDENLPRAAGDVPSGRFMRSKRLPIASIMMNPIGIDSRSMSRQPTLPSWRTRSPLASARRNCSVETGGHQKHKHARDDQQCAEGHHVPRPVLSRALAGDRHPASLQPHGHRA